MERTLPQNNEAEIGVLGSILIDPEAITRVEFLKSDDFYRDAHKIIFEVMLQMYNRHEPADFLTICDELERQNKLDDIGDSSYITTLVNQVPTSANVEYYGKIVEESAQLRRIIQAAASMAAMAYERNPQSMEKAEEMIYSISQNKRLTNMVTLSEYISRYALDLQVLSDRRKRGMVAGIPTGFKVLDQVLGGLQDSDLIILAARPAVGKTSLVLNIAEKVILESALDHKYKVLMFSLEMGGKQLTRRMISMFSGIDQTRMLTGDMLDDDWERFNHACSRLDKGGMWIDDTPGISLSEMRSRARRMKAEHGLDLILVDYLQLMKASSADGKSAENRVQEVSLISSGLKNIARELNVPVLALAQLSRAVDQRADKMPQLSDLRESGSIEQDADIVIFIHQEPKQEEQQNTDGHILNLIVAKHRNGPVGIAPLWFTPSLTRFSDVEQRFLGKDEEEVTNGIY